MDKAIFVLDFWFSGSVDGANKPVTAAAVVV